MEVPSPRKHRLSKSADFDRVYRQGRSAQSRKLVLYRFTRPDEVSSGEHVSRVGVTVSRKVGNAVVRNRVKRQIRAAIVEAGVAVEGCDVVAVARPGIYETIEKHGFSWLVEQVTELAGSLTPSTPARDKK